MTKTELFVKLAAPDSKGYSRWVSIDEFQGEFSTLQFGNGNSWGRPSSSLAKRYNIELDKSRTRGNSIDAIRLVGFNTSKQFNNVIRGDIKRHYKEARCVMLGGERIFRKYEDRDCSQRWTKER